MRKLGRDKSRRPSYRLTLLCAVCGVILRFIALPPAVDGFKTLLSDVLTDKFFRAVLTAELGLPEGEPTTLWVRAVRSQSPLLSAGGSSVRIHTISPQSSLKGEYIIIESDPVEDRLSSEENEAAKPASVQTGSIGGTTDIFPAVDLDPNIRTITVAPISDEGYEAAELVYIKNETSKSVDVGTLLEEQVLSEFDKNSKILIVHTHASEAYYPDGEDMYTPSDTGRSEDERYNMLRVGDEMADLLRGRGYDVVHIREIFDYPSYNGSYTRTLEAIENAIESDPKIAMVLDLHRDAMIAADGTCYRTVCQTEEGLAAQIMIVAGTSEGGLAHPDWRENLALAAQLQQNALKQHSRLMRPIVLVAARYNQHVTPGSLLLEVGTSGNTLQEALLAARLFAQSLCDYLDGLVT